MRHFLVFCSLLFLVFGQATAQDTRINPATMLRPGAANTVLQTDASGNVGWVAKTTVYSAGAGITISAAGVIANNNPNTTRTITGGTGITVSGSDPAWTLSVADQSATNELQTLAVSGTTTPVVTLSNSGGSFTLTAGSGIALSNASGNITVTSTATAPVLSIGRYEEVLAANTTAVAVTGFTPDANTLVFVDGVYMDVGSGEDATLSGSTYTFTRTLLSGQKVVVRKLTIN
jgi:hypothetical protein